MVTKQTKTMFVNRAPSYCLIMLMINHTLSTAVLYGAILQVEKSTKSLNYKEVFVNLFCLKITQTFKGPWKD